MIWDRLPQEGPLRTISACYRSYFGIFAFLLALSAPSRGSFGVQDKQKFETNGIPRSVQARPWLKAEVPTIGQGRQVS